MKSDFVDLMRLFRLDQSFIKIEHSPNVAGDIDITMRGPWLHTILFEVPVLAIVSEPLLARDTAAARLCGGPAPP